MKNPSKFPTVFSNLSGEHMDPVLACDPEEKMTKDSFKDECDPNLIMLRFLETGALPLPKLNPTYGNLIGLDLHQLLQQVADAQEAFEELPAWLRHRFGNDPQRFVEFVMDPENAPELVRMGLAEEKPARQGGTLNNEGGQKPTSAPEPASQEKVAQAKSGTT